VLAPDLPARLRRSPAAPSSPAGLEVRLAAGFRARLLGLIGLPPTPPGVGLLLTRTRSAHTLGMRFALDLVWLDPAGRVLRVDERVPPLRVRTCLRAAALLELAAGGARRAGLTAGVVALEPRRLDPRPSVVAGDQVPGAAKPVG
jgi:uncharacterized membrane protein (UPF0127 family)